MKMILKFIFMIFSPILAIVYWRNSLKNLDADWNSIPHQNQNIDLEMAQA
jgi:hypothetical protein